MVASYEPVIGLEVHAQLLTQTKIFCSCSTAFGREPNTQVCPTCLGLPGALPVLSEAVVRMGVRAALALGCRIQTTSIFARKNYFYPDLPKGYQISQFDQPFALSGHVDIDAAARDAKAPLRIGLTRIHFEEDAGKNLHDRGDHSVVDLNRAGVPLIEIVGEPELHSGVDAAAYLRTLRELLVYLGVNDGNLEEGSFRCDANVSVRPVHSEKLGTRVELKNINSFRFVQRAIEYEIERQVGVLESGGKLVQETRGWDERSGRTYSLRSKEEAQDYRYFPDPDLPPLVLSPSLLEEIAQSLPELPGAKRARYEQQLGLSPQTAQVLTAHPKVAAYFEAVSSRTGDPIRSANFIQSELLGDVSLRGIAAEFPLSVDQTAELLELVASGTISGKQAKEVYAKIAHSEQSPSRVVDEMGMRQVSDEGAIRTACLAVLARSEKQVEQYRSGKLGLFGYFVGQVMKEMRGAGNPTRVNETLLELLGGQARE